MEARYDNWFKENDMEDNGRFMNDATGLDGTL